MPRPFLIRLPGIIYFYTKRWLVSQLHRFKAPTHLEKKEIRKIIRRSNPIIVEIGSADGIDTQEFLETFKDPGLRLYCFEPDPRNIEAFRQRIRDPRVQLFPVAIGDRDGQMLLQQSSTIYSSSLKQPNLEKLHAQWPTIQFENKIEVEVMTLDTFVRQHQIPMIDFVWADVQGAEDLLLRGARQSLRDKIRYFYTEYSNVEYYQDEPDLAGILRAIGPNWEILHDYKTDVLLKNKNL